MTLTEKRLRRETLAFCGFGGSAGLAGYHRKSSYNAEYNAAFVEMQYFGYLRRNPQDPPDNNPNGYNFWLNKLNDFGGDFRKAEMVKAFLVSSEYRQRFGTP